MYMIYNLIDNLNKLTFIKNSILHKLVNISENCICDYVLECMLDDETVTPIDIGIGTLYVNISNNELQYKFIPNKKLEKKLIRTVNNQESPLIESIESNLNDKIVNTYKELL